MAPSRRIVAIVALAALGSPPAPERRQGERHRRRHDSTPASATPRLAVSATARPRSSTRASSTTWPPPRRPRTTPRAPSPPSTRSSRSAWAPARRAPTEGTGTDSVRHDRHHRRERSSTTTAATAVSGGPGRTMRGLRVARDADQGGIAWPSSSCLTSGSTPPPGIRDDYGTAVAAPMPVKMNLVIIDVPFGEGTINAHLDTTQRRGRLRPRPRRGCRRHGDARLRDGQGDAGRPEPPGRDAGIHGRQDQAAGRHGQGHGALVAAPPDPSHDESDHR